MYEVGRRSCSCIKHCIIFLIIIGFWSSLEDKHVGIAMLSTYRGSIMELPSSMPSCADNMLIVWEAISISMDCLQESCMPKEFWENHGRGIGLNARLAIIIDCDNVCTLNIAEPLVDDDMNARSIMLDTWAIPDNGEFNFCIRIKQVLPRPSYVAFPCMEVISKVYRSNFIVHPQTISMKTPCGKPQKTFTCYSNL